MNDFPEEAVAKTVPLRFAGVDLKFKTSHALFSHHHVDAGTMLLLKSLAQRSSVPESGRVLDCGCGYGPLSLALKKYRPQLQVTARDRLALAAAFTAENARLNGLDVDSSPGLLLEDVPGPWDLIVSNIPAKAGEPVLADFVSRSLALLTPQGLVAVVVVENLAPWFQIQLGRGEVALVYQESGPGYRVFHYRRGSVSLGIPFEGTGPVPAFPEVYQRGTVGWEVGQKRFLQKTFYGLPNFDALDYRTQLSISLLDGLVLQGDSLVWEPGQGHLSTWVDSTLPRQSTLHLAGNDALGLAAAAQNLAFRTPTPHLVPTLSHLEIGPGSLGSAFVQFHPEPEVPWVEESRSTLLRCLAPGGLVLANGTSTDLTRFLDRHRGFRIRNDVRSKGWRAVLLERQPVF